MRRRTFIIGFASAIAWPRATRAQQAIKVWRIGMLDSAPRELNRTNVAVFLKRLQELGYSEDRNLTLEYRSADGRNERLPELVSELLDLKTDLLVVRGTPEIVAVSKMTSTLPVVMSAVVDPVGLGLVKSLSHPGETSLG